MLIQRLITALILAPLVLLIILYSPAWFLMAVTLVILLAAGWESCQLIPIPMELKGVQIGFLLSLVLAFVACAYLFDYWISLGLVVWLFLVMAIITFPKSQRYWGSPLIVGAICLMLLPLFGQSLIRLNSLPQGKGLLIYLLFLIWAADVGAYLVGKKWGKHKLIPQVSPGKSWEGALGGFILSMLISALGYSYFHPVDGMTWFMLAALTVVGSMFGDLFISILKRRCHLKDTGALIPGHGGILDRLDSLLAGLPLFYFGITRCL